MNNAQAYVGQAYTFVHGAFLTVDSQVGLLILGLIAALMMKTWKQLWTMALLAVVVLTLAVTLMPLFSHGRFALPDFLGKAFWLSEIALYIGFVIVIAAFFFVKGMVTKTAKAA